MKHYLVTGGAGFIGANLCEELVALGNKVTVIDNLSVGDNNVPLLKKLGVKVVVADIRDYTKIEPHFKGIDTVIHLAAMNRAPRSIEHPVDSHHVNITGTIHVLEAMRKHDVPLIIFSSSSSVYAGREGLLSEEDELAPPHPYGVGKLAGEHYIRIYSELYGIKFVTLRFFTVYGPKQLGNIEHAAVIPKFIHQARNKEPITIFGDGSVLRNFTYVSDVVACCLLADELSDAKGHIINIAHQEETSIKDIAEAVKKETNEDVEIQYLPPRQGDPPRNAPNINKANKILGYKAKVGLKEGIQRSIQWYDQQ